MHRGTKHRGRSGSFSFSSAERDDDDDYNNIQPPALKSSHTAAATPAAADAAAPVDTTLMVSDDIINMVATFASCRDLCNLGQVCRRFSPLPFHEDLWELRALDILYGAPQLRSAMSALSLATCRELVETFTRIGIPGGVLGFWQAEPPSLTSAAAGMELLSARLLSGAPPHRRQQQQQEGGVGGGAGPSTEELETRGELLRIGLEAGGFVCETIAPDGVRRRIFTIRVSKTGAGRVKIGFFSQEREFSLTIGGGDDDWVPGDSMAEAKARYTFAVPGNTKRSPIRASGLKAFFLEREDGRICRYVKLTAPPPLPLSGEPTASAMDCSSSSSSSGGAPAAAAAVAAVEGVHESLCGLWCAPYGSHGLEIVLLSTDSSSSPFDGEAAAAAAAALAEDAAAVAKFPLGAGGGAMTRSSSWSSSWSRVSASRMTDGSESVCTSAPATDDGDGSEAAFCDDDSSGSESGDGGDLDGADDGGEESAAAAAPHHSVDYVRPTTKRRSRRHRAKHHHQQQQQQRSPVGAVTAADSPAPAPAQLFGFKVTGDENVPAGKTSFVIDLATGFDVDEELQSDSRPVVMFLPSGAVMANLANRREQISAWHKGRGQINRVPGRWLPEWVDVEFVAYRPGSRSAFSVIFRQPAQAVRVVMDFERAHGCEEGWPQWPAAAGSAAAAPANAAATARAASGASRSA